MTWTLLKKELRQHWWGLLIVTIAGMLANMSIIGTTVTMDSGLTRFEALRFFVLFVGFICATVLNHRLVVVEYGARTQLFLEALPVARWRMVAVKYGLGLVTLFALVGLAWLLACVLAWRHQAMTPHFALVLLTRALSFCWCLHAFFFLMGLLGRYRFAIYLVLAMGLAILAEHKAIDFQRFGPVALVDSRFAYEREIIPWNALYETWGLGLLFTMMAAGLSLVREGSVAALLAERMSHREKVFIAALVCSFLFVATTLSQKAKKAPFDLKQASTATRAGLTVKVASGSNEGGSGAASLAGELAEELSRMKEYLGLAQLPPVFVVSRRDLDPDRFERGELSEAEGVHVRANFGSAGFRKDRFLAWLLPEVLDAATKGRVKLESRRWVLDGFGLFWIGRDRCEAELTQDEPLALRAIYGADPAIGLTDLNHWLSYRERVGEGIAAGVAWSGLKTITRKHGTNKCRLFLSRVLGKREPDDVRALFFRKGWEQHLQEQIGQAPEALLSDWQEELANARGSLGSRLAAVPRLSGSATFTPVSAESRKARFQLQVRSEPGAELRYSLLYRRVTAFDEEVQPKELQREQDFFPRTKKLELPQNYSRGQRLYWTFAVDVPALGCPVVSGFKRQEVP